MVPHVHAVDGHVGESRLPIAAHLHGIKDGVGGLAHDHGREQLAAQPGTATWGNTSLNDGNLQQGREGVRLDEKAVCTTIGWQSGLGSKCTGQQSELRGTGSIPQVSNLHVRGDAAQLPSTSQASGASTDNDLHPRTGSGSENAGAGRWGTTNDAWILQRTTSLSA